MGLRLTHAGQAFSDDASPSFAISLTPSLDCLLNSDVSIAQSLMFVSSVPVALWCLTAAAIALRMKMRQDRQATFKADSKLTMQSLPLLLECVFEKQQKMILLGGLLQQ